MNSKTIVCLHLAILLLYAQATFAQEEKKQSTKTTKNFLANEPSIVNPSDLAKLQFEHHYSRDFEPKSERARFQKLKDASEIAAPRTRYEEFLEIVDGLKHAKLGLFLSKDCLLYTSPSPRDRTRSRMPSSA